MLKSTIIVLLAVMLGPVFAWGANSSKLEFIVLGVIASNETQNGVALLKHKKTGKVQAFKEGEAVNETILITQIDRKTVRFTQNNRSYFIQVGDETATMDTASSPMPLADVANLDGKIGIEKQGSTLTVSSDLKESLVGENLNKILMQAAAVPHTVNGRLVGFMLTNIDQGSIYDVAGFQDGDIITHIDQKPINNVAFAIKALRNLRNSSMANFSYIRKDEPQELTIRIN